MHLSMIATLQENLWQNLSCHPNTDVIVAYSGGVDSQVLLHALTQLQKQQRISNKIIVCHVNHGLSEHADDWQSFAQEQCLQLSQQLIIKKVTVKPTAQQSLEAVARDKRYQALSSLGQHQCLILTGHHGDDQSETFLLALKRGAGIKGLSAMNKSSTLGQHLLLRPLLTTSRSDIEQYAELCHLSWIEDESNNDTRFDRNFIRKKVMPMLRERWPSISETINRSAALCAQSQQLLDEVAQEDLNECLTTGHSLSVPNLEVLSVSRFNNVIRFFLAQQGLLMPSVAQINQLREQFSVAQDKTPEVKIAHHVFRRYKENLYLTRDYQDVSGCIIELESHSFEQIVPLPDQLGQVSFNQTGKQQGDLPVIIAPAKGQAVTIRFTYKNTKCLPHYRQHSRDIKKVLQELAIPPWQRKRIAFLYYDEQLVSALGYFVCKPFIASSEQACWYINNNSLNCL